MGEEESLSTDLREVLAAVELLLGACSPGVRCSCSTGSALAGGGRASEHSKADQFAQLVADQTQLVARLHSEKALNQHRVLRRLQDALRLKCDELARAAQACRAQQLALKNTQRQNQVRLCPVKFHS